MEENNKKSKYIIISCAILLICLVGVTYSFFNYTRTGAINNLGTGRITFSSNQSDTLNITNLFPMKSTDTGIANLDSVTIAISGDTNYADGEEFEVSIVDVNNTVNDKKIPINFIATYEAVTGGNIGTNSEDAYWESRKTKNAMIYSLESSGNVEEGMQVLVGYIKNDADGIDGTLSIKAYVDADRIAISDTYPERNFYEVNPNMNSTSLSDCVSYLTSEEYNNYLEGTETINAFCEGTGTIGGYTFQESLDEEFFLNNQIEYFIDHNIIFLTSGSGTSGDWVNGREVFTTEEWNSLVTTPISFKIRVESNEGLWVENKFGPLTMEDMCPGCVFTYRDTWLYTTWNTMNETPTVLSSSDYFENYEDAIADSGFNHFLGLKLNNSNEVEKVYACGLYNSSTPFCIEGYYNDSKYERNRNTLQREFLWNNTCEENEHIGTSLDGMSEITYETTSCNPTSSGFSGVFSYSQLDYGNMNNPIVRIGGYDSCFVEMDGRAECGGD